MKAEVLPTRISKWGEGPVWWHEQFWYVDISGMALVCFDPQSGEEKVLPVGQRIGFALPCQSGRWIWGGDHGLYFLDLQSGESTFLHDPEADLPENRFNDAGISPDGRLFAGSITSKQKKGAASLYRFDPDHSCHVAVPQVTNSNGIDWSPDGKTCYYIDTPSYNIRAFTYDRDSGALRDERILFNTEKDYPGVPDGMCVDSDGKLWIAFCHGGCVVKIDPESGSEISRFEFPVVETTSCCFGGNDLQDLYVTTGIRAQEPEEHAGKIFVVRNAGRGMPQKEFNDL